MRPAFCAGWLTSALVLSSCHNARPARPGPAATAGLPQVGAIHTEEAAYFADTVFWATEERSNDLVSRLAGTCNDLVECVNGQEAAFTVRLDPYARSSAFYEHTPRVTDEQVLAHVKAYAELTRQLLAGFARDQLDCALARLGLGPRAETACQRAETVAAYRALREGPYDFSSPSMLSRLCGELAGCARSCGSALKQHVRVEDEDEPQEVVAPAGCSVPAQIGGAAGSTVANWAAFGADRLRGFLQEGAAALDAPEREALQCLLKRPWPPASDALGSCPPLPVEYPAAYGEAWDRMRMRVTPPTAWPPLRAGSRDPSLIERLFDQFSREQPLEAFADWCAQDAQCAGGCARELVAYKESARSQRQFVRAGKPPQISLLHVCGPLGGDPSDQATVAARLRGRFQEWVRSVSPALHDTERAELSCTLGQAGLSAVSADDCKKADVARFYRAADQHLGCAGSNAVHALALACSAAEACAGACGHRYGRTAHSVDMQDTAEGSSAEACLASLGKSDVSQAELETALFERALAYRERLRSDRVDPAKDEALSCALAEAGFLGRRIGCRGPTAGNEQ